MPSRRNAILFFIFTLILAGGVVVWHFFLNRGFLEISGPAPFTISMGVFKKQECAVSPCKISLLPKTYHLTGIKEGYFDTDEEVEVKLFRTKQITFNFQFKPTVEATEAFKLPEKIPKNASRVLFSRSKEKALVWLGKEQYLYEEHGGLDAVLSQISLPPYEAVTWGGGETLLVLSIWNVEEQRLLAVKPDDLKTGKSSYSVITTFKRALKKPEISVEPEGHAMLFQDTSGIYLVDIEKKLKQSITLPDGVRKIRLVGGGFALLSWAEGKITLIPLENIIQNKIGKPIEIPSIEEEAITAIRNAKFYFISAEPAPSNDTSVPIAEIIQKAKEKVTENTWYFISYDPVKNVFLTLTSLAVEPEEVFLGFDPMFIDKGTYFETFNGTKKIRYFLQLDK